MRKTALLFLFISLLSLIAPIAFAEVENVKLSGDVTFRGFYREDYGIGDAETTTYNGSAFRGDDSYKFFMNTVRLRVDADLSQNVEGQIELLNQRDLDSPSAGTQGSGLASGGLIAGTAPSAANDQFDILLSLANITIKNLYYPELTVKVGRQNIQFGEGFVVGSRHIITADPSNTISADEFTEFHGFDAIRTLIDHEPWHVDMFAAKISENAIDAGDDQNLFGFNVGRTFDRWESEAETYLVHSRDGSPANVFGDVFTQTETVYAYGIRGSIKPHKRLKFSGEVVFEWGEEGGSNQGAADGANAPGSTTAAFTPNGRERQSIGAWAYDLRAEWDWIEAPWPTKLGTELVFYSGEDMIEGGSSNNYRLMFRGKYHSAIREFMGFYYLPQIGATPGHFNEHEWIWDASFHPFNNPDLTFFGRWLLYWFDEAPIAGRGKFIGQETDMIMSYDYTEDLKFTFIGALFFPGGYFDRDIASPNQFGTGSPFETEIVKELVWEVALAF